MFKKLVLGLLAMLFVVAAMQSCTHLKTHQQCNGTKVGNKR
jgi:hypothetical protein